MSEAAFNELVADPITFLSNNHVTISGAKSGVKTFAIYHPDCTPDHVYKIDAWLQGHFTFEAHSIEMRTYAPNPSTGPEVMLPAYEMRNDKSPDVMVTGLLTACSFVVLKTTNGIKCTHIQPGGGIAGASLQGELGSRHLEGSPNESANLIYSQSLEKDVPNTYLQTQSATIIGLRDTSDNIWKIYSQTAARDRRTKNKGTFSVTQIY